MGAEITARPVGFSGRRWNSPFIVPRQRKHRKQHCVCCCCLFECLLLLGKTYSLFFLVQQYSTCAVSFGFPPLSPPSLPISPPVLPNITVTICVGHHVVILFRHSAYDGSWSVTADVAGSIGTINKYSVGQALLVKWTLCCSRKLFKCICVKSVRKHGFCNMPEGCNQFDPKKSQEFTLPVSRLKPQSLFNSFSTKVYSTLRPSQRRLFIPWLLFFPAVHHRSLTL